MIDSSVYALSIVDAASAVKRPQPRLVRWVIDGVELAVFKKQTEVR